MMDNKEFIEALNKQALNASEELKELEHQRAKISMEIARAKDYIKKINAFLVEEGSEPVELDLNALSDSNKLESGG